MGLCNGTVKYDEIYLNREVGKYQYEFSCLNLSEDDIGKFYSKFISLDKNKNGTIESKELFQQFGIARSRFAIRVFNYYDIDKSGKIDFREFVLVTWNFCTIDKNNIERFIYDLYDVNKNDELPYSEIIVITKELYGREFKKNQNLQKALQSIQTHLNFTMNIDSFIEFCRRHPFILYPVVLFQTELRSVVNDVKFWDKLTKYRLDLCNNKYMSFETFLPELLDGNLDPQHRKTTLRGRSSAILRNKSKQRISNVKVNKSDSDDDDHNNNSNNNNNNNNEQSSTNTNTNTNTTIVTKSPEKSPKKFFSFFSKKSQTTSMSPQPSSSKSPESSSSTLLPSELIRDSKKNSPNKNKTEKKNPKNIQFANRTEIQKIIAIDDDDLEEMMRGRVANTIVSLSPSKKKKGKKVK